MGVMQVTRPLKPQDSCCVVYLADADSKEKQYCTADDDIVDFNEGVGETAVISKSISRNAGKAVGLVDNLACNRKTSGTQRVKKSSITERSRIRIAETDVFERTEQAFEHPICDQTISTCPSKFSIPPGSRVDESITDRVHKLLESYQDRKCIFDNEIRDESVVLGPAELKRIETISNDIEGEIVRCYSLKEQSNHSDLNRATMKRATRRKTPDIKVQMCGRGRPRKKSFGKKGGGSCDKQSQDGSENGEGRTSRGRQQRNGGQGSSGGNGGGRRRRDDDDRDDDNDDVEDDFDENNEDEDEEEDEQTGTESVVDETELTPEQEAEMAQELLCLIPPKNMNCDPPEKPAKPGTAVNLHGVVLHETTGGLVVLNVRWRNKIYSGALIDVRKSRWASERIKPDPFPEGANVKGSDLAKMNGKRKGKKSKSPDLPEKDSKEHVDTKSDQTFKEPTGVPVAFKRPSEGSNGESTDSGTKKKARFSPPPIECPEPNCGKRYSHKNGLKYHQAHAHQNKPEIEETKPAVVAAQQTPGSDIEPTSTMTSTPTAATAQKILVDQKPQISQIGEDDIKGAIMPSMVQGMGQFTGSAKPTAEPAAGGIAPVIKIKTEEENAVESIKDVKFEESEKAKEGLTDVPKIMLESSTGDEPTELVGTNEPGRMEVGRLENLYSVGNQASLMPFNSRVNYAQFSPTLNPLNPQTLNNSLSNALQTASTKANDKFEADGEKQAIDASEDSKVESRDDARMKLRLDDLPAAAGDAASVGSTLRRFDFGSDVRTEDVVPSSPDDQTLVSDLLPGSLGAHLFSGKETRLGQGVSPSVGFGSDSSGFQASNFSVSLYNQLRQEHATKLFTNVESVTGDLAEPSDIQRAINQVDVSRHFSPMLLNYLNTGSRARDNAPDADATVDEVSTSSKGDHGGKPRKVEGKDVPSPGSSSFTPVTSGGRNEQLMTVRERSAGTLPQKPEFLQPNISVGRPIVKPASKPESITGGLKIVGGANRFGGQAQYPGEKQSEDNIQGEGLPLSDTRSGTPKNLSPTSYVDKQMIEAKTWVPKEVYWQPPQKKGMGTERPQFSPGKEKASRDQSTPVRMGPEIDKKANSPFEHGPAAAEYMKNRGTSPSQGAKKVKQSSTGSVPYPSPVMSASSMESDRGKQHERHSENSQDSSDMPRFTLSNERSIPSPAENRGRPRKIRVEKTQQIPIGSPKDIEGSRGAPDHSSRKQTTNCTYARTSVIHSMATPPEDMRVVPSVKEEYVSPDGKRKSPAISQERMPYEKKSKQDFRKAEASRIFEAEREKLKTRHVDSHYANEVRNMQLRAQEMQGLSKGDMQIRASLSPSSRFQSLAASALEKSDRHARERLETKSIPVSPAYGQGSSYSSHPSDLDKFRSEYIQHELHRLPTPFGGALADVYPGLSVPYSGSGYYAQRPGLSQSDSIAHQRYEQILSNQMEQEKAFAKYEKADPLKLVQDPGKHPHPDRLRPSSRDGHSHRPPFYPHASPLGFQSREPSSASRSPKGSPFGYRLGEILAASRAQRIESEMIAKDSKTSMGDSRRDVRRDFSHPYGTAFLQPSFQYPNLASSKPYSQRMSEQRSPYKHPSEMEKGRYPSQPSSQSHSGPGGMLSANLVLTQADTLGYGSVHYDGRNPDSKK